MCSRFYKCTDAILDILIDESICLKGLKDFCSFNTLSLSAGKERKHDKILGIDLYVGREFCPENCIFQLCIILNGIKSLYHKSINMEHYKPLVGNLIHEFSWIGDVEINEFLFIEVDSDRVDQLYEEILNGCIFLFILLGLEERVFEEEIMGGFKYKSVDILLVNEGGNK